MNSPAIKKFLSFYRSTALLVLNTIVFLIILIAILFFYYFIRDSFTEIKDPFTKKYGKDVVERIYSDMTPEQIEVLMAETWSRRLAFEPFTQFKERPFIGTYVNVDVNGFRHSANQGPWPPELNNFNIFLFGGSTAFGHGLPDNQTVASFLQKSFRKHGIQNTYVYNFGRGHYFSTQERVLFEQLLLSGFVPNMAIFLDGANEFTHYHGIPHFTEDLIEYFNQEGRSSMDRRSRFPLSRLFSSQKSSKKRKRNEIESELVKEPNQTFYTHSKYNDKELLGAVVERYLKNRRMIEAIGVIHGVTTIFVWQPVPTYKYDYSAFHPFPGFTQEAIGGYFYFGYRLMSDQITKHPPGKNFLWCADIQENIKKPLYLDAGHYNSLMASVLAEHIYSLLDKRSLLRKNK